MSTIKIEYLGEPRLQFGQYFEYEDSKTGLTEFGPFGKNVSGLHPSEIKLGFIGTRETISGAIEWVEECALYIESENLKAVGPKPKALPSGLLGEELYPESQKSRLEKGLNRDFIGFNQNTPFQCRFQTNDLWDRNLQSREISTILETENQEERIWQLVGLFETHIESLAGISPTPDIIILALTPEMVDKAHSVRISGRCLSHESRELSEPQGS